MSSQRAINGVLHNFLGTLSSRNSDFEGYWAFGFLVEPLEKMSIDLLNIDINNKETASLAFIKRLAAQKFSDLVVKADLSKSCFREARLDISKSPEIRRDMINGQISTGHDVNLLIHAVTDRGRCFDKTMSFFVAPHDPKVELRSTRAA